MKQYLSELESWMDGRQRALSCFLWDDVEWESFHEQGEWQSKRSWGTLSSFTTTVCLLSFRFTQRHPSKFAKRSDGGKPQRTWSWVLLCLSKLRGRPLATKDLWRKIWFRRNPTKKNYTLTFRYFWRETCSPSYPRRCKTHFQKCMVRTAMVLEGWSWR